MDGCGRCGGCHRRRERACRLLPARITSAWCTKSSLNPPIKKRPGDPPHRDAFCFLAGSGSRRACEIWLLADHNDDEGAWFHFAAAFARGGSAENGGGEKEVGGVCVGGHGGGGRLVGDNFVQ